jgi:hypothetical protein
MMKKSSSNAARRRVTFRPAWSSRAVSVVMAAALVGLAAAMAVATADAVAAVEDNRLHF